MLQGLEAADRYAELLARAQVLERGVFRDVHRADSLGAQGQHAATDRVFECREACAGCAAQRVVGEREVVEAEVGRASAVDLAIAPRADSYRIARDEEERDA